MNLPRRNRGLSDVLVPLLFLICLLGNLVLMPWHVDARKVCERDGTCVGADTSGSGEEIHAPSVDENEEDDEEDDDEEEVDSDEDYEDDDEEDEDYDDEEDEDYDEEEEDLGHHDAAEYEPTPWGIPQLVVGRQRRGTLVTMEKTRIYMTETVSQFDDYENVREDCWLHHAQCTFWASRGSCQDNPIYMTLKCAPACQTCHLLRYENPDDIPDYSSPVHGEAGHLIEASYQSTKEMQFRLTKPELKVDLRKRFNRKGKNQRIKKRSRRSREST
jgi:hypothetical protein